MTQPEWHTIAQNNRPRMCDGVEAAKADGYYSIRRYIDDWDEDVDTIYDEEQYLNKIPERELKASLGVSGDDAVYRWIRRNLIKERSNSLDAVIAYLNDHGISYSTDYRYMP